MSQEKPKAIKNTWQRHSDAKLRARFDALIEGDEHAFEIKFNVPVRLFWDGKSDSTGLRAEFDDSILAAKPSELLSAKIDRTKSTILRRIESFRRDVERFAAEHIIEPQEVMAYLNRKREDNQYSHLP